MKDFPALVSQEVQVDGRGYLEAAVDITLSSIGKCSLLSPVCLLALSHLSLCFSTCSQAGWR